MVGVGVQCQLGPIEEPSESVLLDATLTLGDTQRIRLWRRIRTSLLRYFTVCHQGRHDASTCPFTGYPLVVEDKLKLSFHW